MPEPVAAEDARQIRPYDFQRHEALDRSRLRRLSPVLEVAAHRITQEATSVVRTSFKAEVGELEQKRWEAWANELPEPTYVGIATITPIGGKVVVHAPLKLVHAVGELRLGGSISGVVPARALTDIESRMFGEVTEAVISELFQALGVVVHLSAGPLQMLNSAVLVQMANPAEICLLITLKVTLAENSQHEMVVCLPLQVLLALLDGLERIDGADDTEQDSVAGQVRDRLLAATVEVSVAFPDIVLSTDELLSIGVGDVISLQRPEGLPLRFCVEGAQFCEVVPTTQGRRLACMVIDSPPQEDK